MRKLEPIKDDALTFISNVIASSNKKGINNEESRRKTKEFRDSCSTIVSENEQTIKQYDKDFDANTLEDLENKGQLNNDEKDVFLSLYSFQKKAISQLRETVLTERGYRNDICPLCECDSVTTMDHYLPKEKYALFVIHPRNLIPCCNSCNQHKSENVYKDGKRALWNCYLDNPIDSRFLYCTITTKEGLLTGEFSIDTKGLSEHEAFVIENTMSKKGQKVLTQYNKMVGNEINEIVKRISDLMIKGDNFDDCIQKIKQMVLPCRILNNWKEVLDDALLNSDDFVKYAKEETYKIINKRQMASN